MSSLQTSAINGASTARVRPIAPGDLGAVTAIYNAVVAHDETTHAPRALGQEELESRLLAHSGWAPGLSTPGCELFVAESGQGIIGWGGLLPHTGRPIYDRVAELDVFVSPDRRRQGAGRALARHGLERAAALSLRSLLVLLGPRPAFLSAWALRQGFRNLGRMKGVVPTASGHGDLVVWQKYLTPVPGAFE